MSITAFLGPMSSSNELSCQRVVLGTSDTLHPGVTIEETAGLARWLRWLECHPCIKGCLSIPGQGIYLGCEFNPWSGYIWEAPD